MEQPKLKSDSEEPTNQVSNNQQTLEQPKEAEKVEKPSNPVPQTNNSNTQVTEPHKPKVEEQVIYNIKQEKGGNLFGVLLFFVAILAAVYYLPEIYKNIGKYIPSLGSQEIAMKPSKDNDNDNNKGNDDKDKENPEEIVIYKMDDNSIEPKIDELSLGNFIKTEAENKYMLKFYVINNSQSTFTFDSNTKFYIDLYHNKTYLKSILVYSFEPIASKATKNLTFELDKSTYSKFNGFSIVRKTTKDIPDVTLKNTDGDYKVLKCINGANSTLNYYFINNYLEKIEDILSEKMNVSTYYEDLEYYKNLGNTYDGIKGIQSFMVENPNDGFTFSVNIDLSTIEASDLYKLAKYYYFNYHKESKEVVFEMAALGYTCS
jgi:hypothetical protein